MGEFEDSEIRNLAIGKCKKKENTQDPNVSNLLGKTQDNSGNECNIK